MKRTQLSAGAFLAAAAVFLSHPAHAGTQGVRFATTAPAPVVAASACSIHAALSVEDRPRPIDVHFEGERCSTGEPAPDAIAVDVRIDGELVTVQTAVPGVADEVTQPIVVALGRELRSRVERAMTPPPPPPVRFVEGPPSDRDTKAFSPTMMGFGIASLAAGGLMVFGGTVGAISNIGSYNTGGLSSGVAWLVAGAGLAAGVGLPLLLVGKRQVPRVVASVAPTGGSLRVAF